MWSFQGLTEAKEPFSKFIHKIISQSPFPTAKVSPWTAECPHGMAVGFPQRNVNRVKEKDEESEHIGECPISKP